MLNFCIRISTAKNFRLDAVKAGLSLGNSTFLGERRYLFPPMATSITSQLQEEVKTQDSRLTEEIGVEFVCAVTQALYRSRDSVRPSTYELSLKSGKRWLRRTLECAAVRQAIGASPQQWIDINQVFYLAIPCLEIQSIPSEANTIGGATTSSALMLQNYDSLMKDLERSNDLLLIARNCLATTQRAQNLAGESLLDQQVLKLIDLCVRVTARGYDGETPSRAEQPWANVIGACTYSIRASFHSNKDQIRSY